MAFFARKRAPAPGARSAPHQYAGADPLSIALPALGVLGTIASLASIGWSAGEQDVSGARSSRKISVVLRDAESDGLLILESLRWLNRHLREHGGAKTLGATPFKFGLLGTPAVKEGQVLYRTLLGDISRVAVSAHANVLEILSAARAGTLDAPEEAYYGFGECQERLNGLLAERRGLSAVVDGGVGVAEALSKHVAGLKAFARN
jgi:hypothetical protein